MENSSSSFTYLLNSSNTSVDPQNPSSQQHPNVPPPHYPVNYPPPPFAPNLHQQYPHMFNPFGAHSNYPQFPSTQGSYAGPYHGNMGHYPQGGGQAPPQFGSIAFFGSSRGTSSRGDESSPTGPASPVSTSQPLTPEPAAMQEWSDKSPDESEKKEGRVLWVAEENLRLVSAWLKNSNDPVRGNDKRGDRYWKEVAAEYNKYAH